MDEEHMWDGLACPPMDDYACNFSEVLGHVDISADPDVFFDQLFEQQDCNNKKKTEKQTMMRKYGKGKELKRVVEVLKPNIDVVALSRELACQRAVLEKEKTDSYTSASHGGTRVCKKAQQSQPTNNIKKEISKVRTMQQPPMQEEKKVLDRPEIMSIHQGRATNKMLPTHDEKKDALKLETTKRKMHESYERIKNAKKQRSIKLIELPPMLKTKQKPIIKTQVAIKKNVYIVGNCAQLPSQGKKKPLQHQGRECKKVLLTLQEDKDFDLMLDNAIKRKPQESYDQINNSKKQRTTQIIELQHLPPPMSKQIIQKRKQKPEAKPNLNVVRTS